MMRTYRIVYLQDRSIDFTVQADKLVIDSGLITLVMHAAGRIVLAVPIGSSVIVKEEE